jgi:type I restriction enzyme, S subunit
MAFIAGDAGMTSRTVKFEKCVSILSGFAFQSEFFNTEGDGIPLIRIRDVTRGFSKTFYSSDFDSNFLIQNGDTLIGMDGEFNIAQWSGGESLLNQRVCKISVKNPNEMDERYLVRFLEIELKKIEERTPFVTVKHLSGKTLNEIQIPLPPLEVQKRIASILDAADALRAKRRESLRKLEVLLKSVFLEMFGDPVTNPKGWETRELGKISEVKSGLQVTPARKDNPIEIPYLRVANVYRDFLDLSEIKTIKVTESELQRSTINIGDLLLVEGHGNPDEVGRSAVWDGSIAKCVHQNHLIRVHPDSRICNPEYLSAFLNSDGGRTQLIRLGKTTSGLNTISSSNVRSVKVLLPPLEVQNQYVALLEKTKKSRVRYAAANTSLETLFSSLQDQAFNGTLDSTAPQLAQLEVQTSLF